ncbi:MAG: cytochrome c [Proteobacteria bacterium]|nr:cytochrome c [Pseudomonadota bacterium]
MNWHLEQFSNNPSRSRDLSNWFNCSILKKSGHVLRKHALGFIVLAGSLPLASGPASSGDAETGRALARIWCAQCHVVALDQERATDVGPPFTEIANDPTKSNVSMTAWLTDPHPPMLTLSLSKKQIGDLVAYIKTLKAN